MCTVSIVALAGVGPSYRLVTSRDEQRSRAPGEPPAWRTLGGVRVLSPRDPVGGGTWVATTEGGVTLCLLNGNLGRPVPLPRRARSRGELIERLIGLDAIEAMIDATRGESLDPYPPFRLVAIVPDRGESAGVRIADLFWDRAAPAWTLDHAAPICFVSSGLGDDRVVPRLGLFDAMVRGEPRPSAQDSFHDHVWPERPEISVRMAREDARTVSITAVTVLCGPDGVVRVTHDYRPVADGVGGALASGPHNG